ncbi:hypothetical protein RMCBS344292_13958 [Rhizopus microsporus]|nr:hypothetical protein RMCBS344292_13958 [Rhizopus microsporus]
MGQQKMHAKRPPPLTPSRSRSNSADMPMKLRLNQPTPSRSDIVTKSSPNSPLSSVGSTSSNTMKWDASEMLSFSFFENESAELLNLTKKLGANITLDFSQDTPTTNNITRASQYLESSLVDIPEAPLQKMHEDIEASYAKKLADLQQNYQKIKDASRKALDELTRAKEEFTKEVALRQQHEYTISQLRHQLTIFAQSKKSTRSELAVITKEEVERVAKLRADLDKTCDELKSYRDVLLAEINSLVAKAAAVGSDLNVEKSIVSTEVESLQQERNHLRQDIKSLESVRDDVLHEMIMLNTKNAQLTEINNDLSRRMSEREKEAAAVMAGTSFIHFSPSPSLSSETSSITPMQRKSSENSIFNNRKLTTSPEPKPGFKLKKTMFSKLSGKNKDPAVAIYGQNHFSSSTFSLHPYDKRDVKPSKQSQENIVQHGSHSFQPTSFLRPTKCDGCGETLWGLSELRCAGCLCATHARCLPHVPAMCYSTSSLELNSTDLELNNNCSNSRTSSGSSLFGNDLCTRAQQEEKPVPSIIVQCIQAVEKRGMDYEGIYRKSGGATQMRLIQQSFESGGDPIDLEDSELINDICSVTSILKQYFRELPNPLLTYQLYSKFIDAVSVTDLQEKLDKFYELLSQLPKVNYDTLELLMKHLYHVQEHHDENLMTIKNLAMVFGPTLMRDTDASRELTDMSYKNAVIEFLITHVHKLFNA